MEEHAHHQDTEVYLYGSTGSAAPSSTTNTLSPNKRSTVLEETHGHGDDSPAIMAVPQLEANEVQTELLSNDGSSSRRARDSFASEEPRVMTRTFAFSFCPHWCQNPKIKDNLRTLIGSAMLFVVGLVVFIIGIVVAAVHGAIYSIVFLIAGLLFIIPGAYHLVYIGCAVKDHTGYHFRHLPTFQ